MKKFIVGVAAILGIVGGISSTALAVDAGERIGSFDSQVTIGRDGTARVKETIVYNFGSTPHHGIYRDIPIDYRDGATNYYLTATHRKTIDDQGRSVQAETDIVDGNLRVKLGDPDKTITGFHTYVIDYTLSPIVMRKGDRLFLNLDVLGQGWQVPVDNFSAKVTLEGDAQLSDVQWFGAPSLTGTTDAQHILPGQGITINAFLPDGYTTTYLEPNKPRPMDWTPVIIGIAIAAVPVTILGATGVVFFLRYRRARALRKAQTVIPEYEPPTGLTPGQIGLLQDDSADMREVTATMIAWAVAGHIKISRVERGWLQGGTTYTLTSLQPLLGDSTAEVSLYQAIFSEHPSVEFAKLTVDQKLAIAKACTNYKQVLKQQLTDKGYYDASGGLIEKGTLTDAGAKQWAHVEGFKLYLGVTEKDRLNFTDAPEKTPERFNKLLPYAIALGVEKEWAKQFEGMDLSEQTTWYSGSNMAAFSAASLASDIGTSFAGAVATSNSSVSSSGGSSGGGVGGGGGGSW